MENIRKFNNINEFTNVYGGILERRSKPRPSYAPREFDLGSWEDNFWENYFEE